MADSLGVFPAGTFARAEASYLQTMFIVSRFSSLSGCLNPKLRRFCPRFISPLPGAFYFRGLPGAMLRAGRDILLRPAALGWKKGERRPPATPARTAGSAPAPRATAYPPWTAARAGALRREIG